MLLTFALGLWVSNFFKSKTMPSLYYSKFDFAFFNPEMLLYTIILDDANMRWSLASKTYLFLCYRLSVERMM